MTEYMYNINDEHVIITETESSTIVEYPDGQKKTFDSYDEAINYLYRRGWIF